MRRVFETGELVLFAVVVTLLDLIASYQVVLVNAHVYISSAPILALYATKAAVHAKTFVGVFLLALFLLIKHPALRTSRLDRIIRAALYAYITFVYAAHIALLFTLESLLLRPPAFSPNPGFSAGILA